MTQTHPALYLDICKYAIAFLSAADEFIIQVKPSTIILKISNFLNYSWGEGGHFVRIQDLV
jgi:hypothetical protein